MTGQIRLGAAIRRPQSVVPADRQDAIVERFGVGAADILVRGLARISRHAGTGAGEAVGLALEGATRRLAGRGDFELWLSALISLAEQAPESVVPLAGRMESLMTTLGSAAFAAWIGDGLRLAGGDAARRRAFFSFEDPQAETLLQREAGGLAFTDICRRLGFYLKALWPVPVSLRTAPGVAGGPPARRTSFSGRVVFFPQAYPGAASDARGAIALFHAAAAHVGAHLRFSSPLFEKKALRPIQVAIVSLLEDARVEQRAMQEFPGLRALWRPFHGAEPSSNLLAPELLARLARALFDPEYADGNGWVEKGRRLFFEGRGQWDDPGFGRALGVLLGNDLGQARIPFNARTYVVEPVYRDDNAGLWDFDDAAQSEDSGEMGAEAARIERQDRADPPPGNRRESGTQDQGATRVRIEEVPPDPRGQLVARYPEWDYAQSRERGEWTSVFDSQPRLGAPEVIDYLVEQRPDVSRRINSLVKSARVSRPMRVRGLEDGETLDIDACIAAAIQRRVGGFHNPRIYTDMVRKSRDLSVLVLLDTSESTNDLVAQTGQSILATERQATAFLAQAMDALGDPFAVHAFCSNGRGEVRYQRLKDFDTPYDRLARARLAGLRGGLSTRMGAALRHAGHLIAGRRSYRRLVLIVTDGEPSDIDVSDARYLVDDAHQAVAGLAAAGIDVFCVALGAGTGAQLANIFGRRNVIPIAGIERLPEKLPLLYLRISS